jgi:hypothetical protein
MGFTLMRPRRQAWDETTPDGTPVMDIGLPESLRRLVRRRPSAMFPPPDVIDTPAPSRSVIETAPDESGTYAPLTRPFSVEAPAAEFPSTPAPLARRTIDMAPPTQTFDDSPDLTPMPPEVSALRRRYTRPEMPDTGNPRTDLQSYAADLEGWRNPADRNGRLKSFGLATLRGLARGLATGNLGAGIGSAIAEGVHGLAAPNLDEREQRDEELARTYGRLGHINAVADADLKRRTAQATLEHTQAETDALRRPKPKEPKLFQGADGLQYEYDPDTKTAKAVPGQGSKSAAAKVLRTTVRSGKVWYETEEGLKPALDPQTGEQLAEPMREITLDGQKFSVPETKAAEILGGIEAADTASRNQYGNQTYSDTLEAQKREQENQSRLRTAAETEAKAWNAQHDKLDELVAQRVGIASLPDDQRAKYAGSLAELDRQIETAKARLSTTGNALRSKYPGVLNYNDAERFEVAPPSQLPALPQRPAPQRRSGTAAPRQQARPANDPLGLFN